MVTVLPLRRFIATAETYGNRLLRPGKAVRDHDPRPATWVHHAHWHHDSPLMLPPDDAFDPTLGVLAYVNRARWVARCYWCPGAQLVHPADKRFFCVDCLHEGNGMHWVRVIWPHPTEVAAIEAALQRRPLAVCNWEPPETSAQLRAENEAMGWT